MANPLPLVRREARRKMRFHLVSALAAGALLVSCGGGSSAPEAPPVVTFTLTPTAGAHGTIQPAQAVTVVQGGSQTFTVTPEAGYVIGSVTVDGAASGTAATYTFSDVRANHSIAVAFTPAGGVIGGAAWADEFDGTSLDTTKWAFDLGNGPSNPGPLYGWGNGEMEYYTSSKDNVALVDGKLVITARRQAFGGQPFTSARLVTRGKYRFNKGRFEARIKMPEGNRMWPAFWLLGDRVENWPLSGEIDIAEMFCGTAGRGDNAVFATAHWWNDALAQHAMDGVTFTAPAKLSADFHVYELVWDATHLRGRIDGNEYWALDITDPALSELRDNYFYVILNLAVGSPNFGMTSPDQADGPMPQQMIVDYVRVYPETGSTVVDDAAAQPHGDFGVLADGTPTASHLDPATDSTLLLWNNLDAVTGTPAAGTGSLAVRTRDGSWFGFGYAATQRRNLLNYAAGYLNVSIKTTSQDNFKIGINGGNDGDAWVAFNRGSDPFGFLRDGAWHKVAIPMTLFGNADFTDIRQFFMVAGSDAVTPGSTFEFDEIYWSENAPENLVRPAGTKFGIFTDRVCDAGSYDATTDGAVNLWNPGNLQVTTGTPFEGTHSYAFKAPDPVWYGLGFAPAKLFDLKAFAGGHLHIALKVPATCVTDFKLGIKSPGGTAVRESWIPFRNGADPYGLVRDGAWHQLVIPCADFCNSDFGAISQLLMLAGDGPAVMEFDDVYLTAD